MASMHSQLWSAWSQSSCTHAQNSKSQWRMFLDLPGHQNLGLRNERRRTRVTKTLDYPCTWSYGRKFIRRTRLQSGAAQAMVDKERHSVSPTVHLTGLDVHKAKLEEYMQSDFDIYPHVSVGLGGKEDELVYEALVTKEDSMYNGMKVVLRTLRGRRALRRGQQALEVNSRVGSRTSNRQRLLTQVHGYVRNDEGDSGDTLTLVHTYDGFFSLHCWLRRPDWLAELESRLGAHDESVRRFGDERTGGAKVTRQLRVVRMVLRDLLTAINYLHLRGVSQVDINLRNMHVGAKDRRVKVGILGSMVNLPRGHPGGQAPGGATRVSRQDSLLRALDVKKVGIVMAQLCFRELMDEENYATFAAFLRAGHPPEALREYLRHMLCRESPWGSKGMQMLDRDGGAGWHLLAALLSTKPLARISCADALRHPFLCKPRGTTAPSLGMVRWAVGTTILRIVEEYFYLPSQRAKLANLISILERMNPLNSMEDWEEMVEGTWRVLYHTGLHRGLRDPQHPRAATNRGPVIRIGNVLQTFTAPAREGGGAGAVRVTGGSGGSGGSVGSLTMRVDADFEAMPLDEPWPVDKRGMKGKLTVQCDGFGAGLGTRLTRNGGKGGGVVRDVWVYKGWRSGLDDAELDDAESARTEQGADVVLVSSGDPEYAVELDYRGTDHSFLQKVLREVRLQIPREMFNVDELVACSYMDARLLVLRTSSSKAIVLTRYCKGQS